MGSSSTAMRQTGAVVIGRNEGERLVRCLGGLTALGIPVVYVDSSSNDGSPERAREMGVTVVPLSLEKPFTAGRARNAGFAALMQEHGELRYVQFVDGDCEVLADWLPFAASFLDDNVEVAIVCGRRKERHPEHSVYNRLCDVEWDTPVGEAEACGGDFLVRAHVFGDSGGFNDSLIAGEEPEMCHRLRRDGWRIFRVDKVMTHHDAAMTRLSQWAKRTYRSGYAYAARAALHWRDSDRYCWRENARITAWAFLIPLLIAGLALAVSPWMLLLALVYPLHLLRTARYIKVHRPQAPALTYSAFTLLGKWPEFYGQMLFLSRWLRGQEQRIIEYK